MSDDVRLIVGDCVEVMATLEANSVDAIVTDPPYGLEFMGKEWDRLQGAGISSTASDSDPFALQRGGSLPFGGGGNRICYGYRPGKEMQDWHHSWALAALRVAKPGAHLVAFGGTRTFHRLTCALEDAGWEIRDCLSWLYGSGFPKSHNLDGERSGWGTALKPAWEPIILARKPLVGTVAANVEQHGTGAINVDGCRIESPEGVSTRGRSDFLHGKSNSLGSAWSGQVDESVRYGRWPANVVLDEEAARLLDEQSGERDGCSTASRPQGGNGAMFDPGGAPLSFWYGDTGGASRFFYVAKASRSEREAGLSGHARNGVVQNSSGRRFNPICDNSGARVQDCGCGACKWTPETNPSVRNFHPTVKPVSLMRWLVRLVTPRGGLVLDPFAGSGTTLLAAIDEGAQCIGIEKSEEYAEIAKGRLTLPRQPSLL